MSIASGRIRRRARHLSTASSYDEDTVVLKASYLSIASESDPETFQVAYAGNVQGENTWYATLNRIPVAMAVASETAHPDIFNKEVFAEVVQTTASEVGIPAALEQFNFKELQPEIEVGEHVSREIRSAVEEQVGEIRAEAAADKAELADRVSAALAIAATGINRGFFKGRHNPIKDNLCQSLASVGISNPEALIAKAFADGSDEYHRQLMAQASEIMQYDIDVQNQLAEALSEAQPVAAVASSGNYGPLGRPVQEPKEKVVATASASGDDFAQRMQNVLRGL